MQSFSEVRRENTRTQRFPWLRKGLCSLAVGENRPSLSTELPMWWATSYVTSSPGNLTL